MLFNEIYGCYYDTVAAIIKEAQIGTLTRQTLDRIIRENGFEESYIEIPRALRTKEWPFLNDAYHTTIVNKPITPLTKLEKQWLKALLLDPRICLFAPDVTWLDDVEPLFTPKDFVYYDRYSDADPYTDENYIRNFRVLLKAIHEKHSVRISFTSYRKQPYTWEAIPKILEYSAKDDKFRVRISTLNGRESTINVSQIESCEYVDVSIESDETVSFETNELIFEVADERNALERALLHFSHFEKKAEKLDDGLYRIRIMYQKEDEKEIIIRILSFGPRLRVISPNEIIAGLKARIQAQLAYRPSYKASL